MELISRTINNRPTFVRPQATVLQACEAAGVVIPRFCYHEKLSVAGNCRRCLVEVQKSPKPVVSCARPVAKGRVIYTDTPLVRKAREAVLEFLLINHPLDCPICDQGGECDLQDEALTYGSDRGRYFEFKRSVEDKECGPIVKTIRTRCIHCTRCVRFSTEVAGNEVRGAFGRGEDREIGTYIHSFLRTELSGNLVDLCPVGALTSKPYAYQARSWELQRVDTLDFFDAICSDISVQTRKRSTPRSRQNKLRVISQEEILRILPRQNGIYSENWITDRSRYAFDGLKQSRLLYPSFDAGKGRPVGQTWVDALTNISYSLIPSNNKNFAFVAGSHINLESAYSLSVFSKILGFNSIFQTFAPAQLIVDVPFFYSLNRTIQSFSEQSRSSAILINTNLRFEASLLNTLLRREQSRRALSYATIGVFNSLRYTHNHQGNSLRSLLASVENRTLIVKSSLLSSTGFTSILSGIETFRGRSGYYLQGLSRVFGKRLFAKTVKSDRLGYIHSSVGSLAFAHLGQVNAPFADTRNGSTMFSILQNPISNSYSKRYFKAKNSFSHVISIDTHRQPISDQIKGVKNVLSAVYLPSTSFYERTGHFRVLDGRVRKHYKAVTPVSESRNLEVIFSALCRKQGAFQWYSWTDALSRFDDENPRSSLINVSPIPFVFNLFNFDYYTVAYSKLFPFHQTVRDFYLQEPIAAYSSIRGECSLFLGREGNFFREN